MKNKTTLNLVFCGLFAALTAVTSQIAIPIGPIPINLATFSVFLAGAVLGAQYGALSQAVYVLLGVVGLPVFAGFRGGAQAIVGPTGGYIIGYIAAAWTIGLLSKQAGKKIPLMIGCLAAGLAVCYLLGTAWFMFATKTGLWASLMLCVFPFLIGDAAKIAAAVAVIPQLTKAMQKSKRSKAE